MKACGVDPGKISGISLVLDGKIIGEWEARSLLNLWDILSEIHPDILVVEGYLGHRIRPSNFEAPIEAIGVCKLYAEERGIQLKRSNPSILQGHKKPRGDSAHIWSARVHVLSYIKRSKAL